MAEPTKQTPKQKAKNKLLTRFYLTILQIIAGAIVISIIILLLPILYPTYKNVTIVMKTPVLVWYTEVDLKAGYGDIPWLPKQPRVHCKEFNRTCDVLAVSSYNDTPNGVIFYGPFIRELPKRNKSIWAIVYDDSPKTERDFINETTLNLFNFSATFSRYSDVPMPLISMKSIDLLTSKEFFVNTSVKSSLLPTISPILYLQSDCDTFTERDTYVQKLMELIPIDSYGKCLTNRNFTEELEHYKSEEDNDLPHLYTDEILAFIAKHKFVIAIENTVCNDYISEMLWRALSVGVVPIYFGDPNIRDWLPNNKSAILLEDYPTPQLLNEYLHELLQNDSKYDEYLDHKIKGVISNQHLLKEIKERPYQNNFMRVLDELYCKMCYKLYNIEDKRINIVTSRHYECAMPTSALTLSVNPASLIFGGVWRASEMDIKYYLG